MHCFLSKVSIRPSHHVGFPRVVSPLHQPVGVVPRDAVPVDADGELGFRDHPRVGRNKGVELIAC